jgi:DNA modification methylase
MPELADGSVQCCVTSPPYYGLRDYGVDEQIGLEPTVDAYVERMVGVFREVRRVLRDDGTLWLNLGDSYAGSWGAQSRPDLPDGLSANQVAAHPKRTQPGTIRTAGLKPKDLIGVPWRVAFALQADGWWLRDAIIWAKPNPMPSSVADRCTSSYEFVFMLAKSARYFADMNAVREPLAEASIARAYGKTNGNLKAVATGIKFGGNKAEGYGNETYSGREWVATEGGANLRNVWNIATTPYSDAHFATFPLELPLRCIRIGCPEGGLVLDPFMGSGTVAQAAESIGRRWVGYELNPEYLPLIAERTRQTGLFAS